MQQGLKSQLRVVAQAAVEMIAIAEQVSWVLVRFSLYFGAGKAKLHGDAMMMLSSSGCAELL